MAEIKDYSVPGKKVVKLVCITPDNNNKYYNLYEQADGSILAQYGRIKGTEVTHTYSGSEWDKIYRSKTKKGYEDMTHLYQEILDEKIAEAEENGEAVTQAEIQNRAVKALFDKLMAYAKKTVATNYTVSTQSVTQAMVDAAQDIINDISKLMVGNPSVEELNNKLLALYKVIPRQMSNVRDHLFKSYSTKDDRDKCHKMIAQEQSILDTMAGQVAMIKSQRESEKGNKNTAEVKKSMDMLQSLGLEVEEVNDKEIKVIKDLMGPNASQFRKAFRVTNKATQEKFDKFVNAASNKSIELYWHGSRNENWFNIIQTGLLIRPSGAVYTGSMFSDGIYFADKAKKSIGYSSLRGSYWAGGSDNTGFLALYKVHTGNPRHIYKHTSECYTITKQKLAKDGFDSVFAHGGADLVNNEFIIYDPSQCTIGYVIEIGN